MKGQRSLPVVVLLAAGLLTGCGSSTEGAATRRQQGATEDRARAAHRRHARPDGPGRDARLGVRRRRGQRQGWRGRAQGRARADHDRPPAGHDGARRAQGGHAAAGAFRQRDHELARERRAAAAAAGHERGLGPRQRPGRRADRRGLLAERVPGHAGGVDARRRPDEDARRPAGEEVDDPGGRLLDRALRGQDVQAGRRGRRQAGRAASSSPRSGRPSSAPTSPRSSARAPTASSGWCPARTASRSSRRAASSSSSTSSRPCSATTWSPCRCSRRSATRSSASTATSATTSTPPTPPTSRSSRATPPSTARRPTPCRPTTTSPPSCSSRPCRRPAASIPRRSRRRWPGCSFDSIVGPVSVGRDHQLIRPAYVAKVVKQGSGLGFEVVKTVPGQELRPQPSADCKL